MAREVAALLAQAGAVREMCRRITPHWDREHGVSDEHIQRRECRDVPKPSRSSGTSGARLRSAGSGRCERPLEWVGVSCLHSVCTYAPLVCLRSSNGSLDLSRDEGRTLAYLQTHGRIWAEAGVDWQGMTLYDWVAKKPSPGLRSRPTDFPIALSNEPWAAYCLHFEFGRTSAESQRTRKPTSKTPCSGR